MSRLAAWGCALLLVATGACSGRSTRSDDAAVSGRRGANDQGGNGGNGGNGGANSAGSGAASPLGGASGETGGTAGSSGGTTAGRTATAGSDTGGALAADGGALGEGGDGFGASSGAGDATAGSGASGGTEQPETGPVIVSLSGSELPLLPLTGRNVVELEAVVTDADGVDDIVGGVLVDPQWGSEYGTFAATTEAGTYTLALDWERLNAVKALDANPLGGERVVVAVFWDKLNHEATRDVTLPFSCTYPDDTSTITYGCCAGERVDLFNDNLTHRCGSCESCGIGPTVGASGFTSCAGYRCRAEIRLSTRQTCASACASAGVECEEIESGEITYVAWAYYGAGNDGPFFATLITDCDAVPPESNDDGPFRSLNCWCAHGEKADWLESAPGGP